MSYFDEPTARPGWGMYKRFAVAGVVIVLLTAAAVSLAALLQVKTIADTIKTGQRKQGPPPKFQPNTITKADAGEPQTLLLVGSDRRYGAAKGDARSDTLMLMRLDPDQQATAVMSIPRDLLTDIPGVGRTKINQAYSKGGLDLTARTVETLTGLPINHVIGVNFKGFRKAVDFVGCVYADVDRRYYHSNLGLPAALQYAEIDIQPGYQQLCGQKALDYVRFRHADSAFVRAARQQDFLRQAKDQVGTSRLISDLKPLIRIFSTNTQSDPGLYSIGGILRLLKLAAYSTGHPIRTIDFPGDVVNSKNGALGDYVTASPEAVLEAVDRFEHAKASPGPRETGTSRISSAARRQRRKSERRPRPADYAAAGLVDARRTGEDLVTKTVASGRLGFPLYFPAALTLSGRYPQSTKVAPQPRVYTLRDRAGKPHEAYRLVVLQNELEGQYYGVQGTTWRTPPLLDKSGDRLRMAGRTYTAYYDGPRMRIIAWRTPRAVYWVTNTLILSLSNKQMSGIARSLTRVGG